MTTRATAEKGNGADQPLLAALALRFPSPGDECPALPRPSPHKRSLDRLQITARFGVPVQINFTATIAIGSMMIKFDIPNLFHRPRKRRHVPFAGSNERFSPFFAHALHEMDARAVCAGCDKTRDKRILGIVLPAPDDDIARGCLRAVRPHATDKTLSRRGRGRASSSPCQVIPAIT